jgi:hypothetical protein
MLLEGLDSLVSSGARGNAATVKLFDIRERERHLQENYHIHKARKNRLLEKICKNFQRCAKRVLSAVVLQCYMRHTAQRVRGALHRMEEKP